MSIELPIKGKSPKKWALYITENLDEFLQDHAACERKAAALAMSFVAKYPDRTALIDPMISLAREELEHFQQVFHLIHKRGQTLRNCDEKDPYINEILKNLRHGREERFLDRLIMSGLVEARGYERFHLLSEHLSDETLKTFYAQLAEREAGHYRIFVRIANHYFSKEEVHEAINRISDIEGKAMGSAPIRATLH
ncbi:MAG: tRNA-(ms[2]io[6]A)-hydroxylase [Oligoflexales bacterium]|nr:tRNA-(ms[2]io[6]A)-hydroxylase [Oligoflexales bacterium]